MGSGGLGCEASHATSARARGCHHPSLIRAWSASSWAILGTIAGTSQPCSRSTRQINRSTSAHLRPKNFPMSGLSTFQDQEHEDEDY